MDLKKMSRQELLKLQSDVEKALKDAEVRDRKDALLAAEKAVAKFGYSLSELSPDTKSGKKGGKAAPKYRNPADPSQTWTGRGRKPQWIHEALTAGADISDLEI